MKKLLFPAMMVIVTIMASGCGKKDPAPDPNNNNNGFTELSNLYKEPVTTWGITKTNLIAQLGTPSGETSDSNGTYLDYESGNAVYPRTLYGFNNNNTLFAAVVAVLATKDDVKKFLDERYTYYSSGGNFIGIYINTQSINSAKTVIRYYSDKFSDGTAFIGVEYDDITLFATSSSVSSRSHDDRPNLERKVLDAAF